MVRKHLVVHCVETVSWKSRLSLPPDGALRTDDDVTLPGPCTARESSRQWWHSAGPHTRVVDCLVVHFVETISWWPRLSLPSDGFLRIDDDETLPLSWTARKSPRMLCVSGGVHPRGEECRHRKTNKLTQQIYDTNDVFLINSGQWPLVFAADDYVVALAGSLVSPG